MGRQAVAFCDADAAGGVEHERHVHARSSGHVIAAGNEAGSACDIFMQDLVRVDRIVARERPHDSSCSRASVDRSGAG